MGLRVPRSALRIAALATIVAAGGASLACRQRGGATATLGERTRLTFTGHAAYPAISGDGKRLAYAEPHCRGGQCAYSIKVQDVGATTSRDIGVEATTIWTIRWSPDNRNLLFTGVAQQGWASYLVPAVGGAPARVAPECAILTQDGRSIVWTNDLGPGTDHWLQITGLDGKAKGKLLVRGAAEYFVILTAVPNSPWIIVRLGTHAFNDELRAIDLSGKQGGSFAIHGLGAGAVSASADAIWTQLEAADSTKVDIVRVPFDPESGRFGAKSEILYTGDSGGSPALFSVTADGRTLAVNEAKTEFGAWAANLEDVLQGTLPADKQLLHSITKPVGLRISPDGQRLLMMRPGSSASGGTSHWTIAPFPGGPETPLRDSGGAIDDARWNDSSTLRLKEQMPHGTRFSLLDLASGQRRASLDLPAGEAVVDYVSLPDGSWAWTSGMGTAMHLQRGDQASPRSLPIPGFVQTIALDATKDGKQIAIFGSPEPAADSPLGVSVMSLPEGRITSWWSGTSYDDPARASWLPGGSMLMFLWNGPGTVPLYRLDAPGHVKKLGTVPRSLSELTVSRDLQRAAIVTNDFSGDTWLRKVSLRK